MTIPKHLDEAAGSLRDAAARIQRARTRPVTLESVRDWLEALSYFTQALSDVHSFTNESVHEKLHDIAGRVGLREFPPPPGRTSSE